MKNTKIINFTALFLFIGFLLLTIGYAQVAYDLSVTGQVSMNSQNGVVVKNVTEAAKLGTNTEGIIKNYVATTLTNGITLDQDGSSYVIYAIQVENTDASSYKFANVLPDVSSLASNIDTYTNRFIKPSILTNSEVSTLFPSATNTISLNGTLPGASTRTFYLKYSYDSSIINNGIVSSSYQELETALLNFSFKKIYSITYTNITGNYLTTAVHGETFSVDFGTNAPNNVSVTNANNEPLTSGTDYTYSNGVLSFPDGITSNITIVGQNGNTPGPAVEDHTTTVYNPENIPPNSNVIYAEIDGQPQVITDSSGNITSFEFTDISDQNPVTISSNAPLETGFIPFDGSSNWELNMKFKYASEDNSSTTSSSTVSIVSCVDWEKNANNVNYLKSGFALRFQALANKNGTTYKYNDMLKFRPNIQASIYDSDTQEVKSQTFYGFFTENSSGVILYSPVTFTLKIRKVGTTITATLSNDILIEYSPTSSNSSGKITANPNTIKTITWQDNGNTSNVDITVGGYLSSSGSLTQQANIEIYNFSIEKIN